MALSERTWQNSTGDSIVLFGKKIGQGTKREQKMKINGSEHKK